MYIFKSSFQPFQKNPQLWVSIIQDFYGCKSLLQCQSLSKSNITTRVYLISFGMKLYPHGNPLLFLLMAITFYESSMRDLPFLPKQCISQKSFPSLQLSKSRNCMPMHEYPRVLTFLKFQKPSSNESSFPI